MPVCHPGRFAWKLRVYLNTARQGSFWRSPYSETLPCLHASTPYHAFGLCSIQICFLIVLIGIIFTEGWCIIWYKILSKSGVKPLTLDRTNNTRIGMNTFRGFNWLIHLRCMIEHLDHPPRLFTGEEIMNLFATNRLKLAAVTKMEMVFLKL